MPAELLYADTSALVKLVVEEPESPEVDALVRERPAVVSSVIAAVELPRVVRRMTARRSARDRADRVLAALGLISLDERIVGVAARLEPPDLRSLDAVHLASALSLGDDLRALCTYDARLAAAARAAGVEVLGAPS